MGWREQELSEEEDIFEGKWYEYPIIRNAIISGLLTVSAYSLAHRGIISSNAEIFIFIIAILIGGYHWGREGIEELFEEQKIDIEILMMAATIGSALLGIWDEAAFLVFLYSAAEGLEDYTYARTRGSIRALLDLAPKEARIVVNGKEVTVPVKDLAVGDLFVVRPGESIPTDGVIERGRSSIDEAPVTGESMPVEKHEGLRVFAGTMNREGALEIKAATSFEDNTLSKIIHLVEEAQEEKGQSQLFIEKFGSKYSPLVLLTAILLILVSPFLKGGFSEWSVRAVVLLVAAAPCALVMSTPVAIAAGIGRAGKSGVLIKGGVHLENLGKIKAVAFDKTGTLTKGKPVVTDVLAVRGNETDVLRLAYSVERLSEHPLAQAIVEKAKTQNLEAVDVDNFACLIGSGVSANLEGRTVYAGKPEFFEGLCISMPDRAGIEKLRNEGKTVIFVGTANGIEGIIGIRDEVRANVKEIVNSLHKMGAKAIMLTGDSDIVARAISKELNIDEYRANLKPAEKTRAVEELEREYGAVAMVGDGINDAPALAKATVGIAMGAAGTDAAIEAADVALMADDLTKITYAIDVGKKARMISRQNIAFSLLILAVLIPSALLGVLSVAEAVFFHESSEILAVMNGLRV
ncbi:MAG: cadmium-translocating P-type ATPase, partial [Methanotrichaceae archaeon]|nr:cadmium-translocating P-type ATPase [Methanotrichaceae archaeon]